MNIFYLDRIPERAARSMIDSHIVKMPVETAQIICTAALELGASPSLVPYKPTHQHHPCVRWVMMNKGNPDWLKKYFDSSLKEFQARFGHSHAALTGNLGKLRALFEFCMEAAPGDPQVVTTPALAMPPWFKVHEDCDERRYNAVYSYRNFYYNDKRNIVMGNRPSAYFRREGSLPPFMINMAEDPLAGVRLHVEGHPTRELKLIGHRNTFNLGTEIRTIHASKVGRKDILIEWKSGDGVTRDEEIVEDGLRYIKVGR